MKKVILLGVALLLLQMAKSQTFDNFYQIKEQKMKYYEQLKKELGEENMQGTGYNPFMRWVNFWEPLVYPHGNFDEIKNCLNQYANNYSAPPYILKRLITGI